MTYNIHVLEGKQSTSPPQFGHRHLHTYRLGYLLKLEKN